MADPAEPATPSAAPASPHDLLLHRPPADRRREFKYRFGQSVVFGAPVLALQYFGRSLGGPEADRWVTLFQALLAGWVMYVAAAGMLVEGAWLLFARFKLPGSLGCDFAVAGTALLLYGAGIVRLISVFAGNHPARGWPWAFAVCVSTLACWVGLRWVAQKKRPGRSTGRA